MPRRRVAERREVLPDPVYNSPLVTKFISGIMWGGKKSLAEGIFYTAMSQVGDKTGEEPLKVFKRAIDNVKPTVEVESRRVGGSTYQVPIEVHQERRGALAIRWIVSYARGRGEKTISPRIIGADKLIVRGSDFVRLVIISIIILPAISFFGALMTWYLRRNQ